MVPRRHTVAAILFLLATAALPGYASARQKTDLVYLKNGDRLTGEIKQLDRGILSLSTDAISTVSIEWADVDSVNSVYQFRVEDREGDKLFGSIFLGRDHILQVIRKDQVRTVARDSVVTITPLEKSFWQQLDGSVSLSFNYTKSDDISQLSTSSWVLRRSAIRQTRIDFSSTLTNTGNTEKTLRYDTSIDHRRLLRGVMFGEIQGGAQRNDELGLDLRMAAGAGLGANLAHSNRMLLVGSAGLSLNHEWASDGTQQSNLEGVLNIEHDIYTYNFPKTTYAADISFYPSLSNWGRIRLDASLDARREIVSDFYLSATFYENYDSDPPGGGEKTDYGFTFGIAWSF